MRRHVAIDIAMFVAVLGLLVATVLPHHHHSCAAGDIVVPCFANDEEDDCDANHEASDSPCLAHATFNVAKQQVAPTASSTIIIAAIETRLASLAISSDISSYAAEHTDHAAGQTSPDSTPRRGPPAFLS